MKHARPDYDRIQDPSGLIPEDEPVFLLRAQDRFAADAVEAWIQMLEANGGPEDIIQAAREQVERMRAWSPKKTPDLKK